MVLAELGRKIRNAIGSLSRENIINEDVSELYTYVRSFLVH